MARRTPINIVNAVNNEIKRVYQYTLPAVTAQNFSDMAAELRNAPAVVQNAWHDTLVNLVGMQIIKNKRSYESIFRRLHQGTLTTFDVQLSMVDVISAKTYSPDANADDFFEDDKPEIQAQYTNRVVKLKFPVSINEENLFGAFISQDAFNSYLNAIETSLYSSLEMADVELTKELINANVAEGNFYIVAADKPVDQASALNFTKEMKKVTEDLRVEMSNRYNLSGLTTWTPEEDGIIISGTDVKAVAETYALAWAFNKDYINLEKGGQAITVASDSIADGKVYALYADKYAFEIREIEGFPKTASQYFGNTLTLKRWLHYWALYTISYFNNVVAFAAADDIAITSATLGTASGTLTASAGDVVYNKVTAIVVPSGKVGDKFGTWDVTGGNSNNTAIDAHSGKLYIGSDETAETLTVTWTSHLDDQVTAQQTITLN